MNSVPISALRPFHYMALTAGLSLFAWATYCLLQLLGLDPLWSVALATKWCTLKEWIHLDTTLFYSLVRDVSSLAGENLIALFPSFTEQIRNCRCVIILNLIKPFYYLILMLIAVVDCTIRREFVSHSSS